MKDIMNDLTIQESRYAATEKWKEYVAAEKMHKSNIYSDLKKVYNQVKSGRKIIDIFKVIQKGGVHDNQHPKLAIAQIRTKTIWCQYLPSGKVQYINRSNTHWGQSSPKRPFVNDVVLENCLPVFDREMIPMNNNNWRPSMLQLKAPVPPVPPRFMPKSVTDDYYILWEIDKWEMVPPTDPWLLKRITKTLFVVLAGWDLTEIEKSVMHGRMY